MNPAESLTRSIAKSSSSKELVVTLSDVGIDQFIDSGVLRDIPIVGSIVGLVKAGNEIQAFLFARKVLAFLAETEKVPLATRAEFVAKHCDTKANSEHVGEVLLSYLSNIDHVKQAQILGRIFARFMLGEISRGSYDWHSAVARSLNPYLIAQIEMYYGSANGYRVDAPAVMQLANLFLLEVDYAQADPRMKYSNIPLRRSPRGTNFGSHFFDHYLKGLE
ncbi:MAG: hypothetical protein R3332_08475 [Pseudohongiellaceae bacterium]|nr:hypothetical protein [Pseudohongiellaceae bacterium]